MLPALLGAIAFMFNDVLIMHIGNLNLIAVAAWLPLILALYARGLSERRASWIIGSGVVFAMALLAGHAQMTAITLIGLMAVAVWQIIIASGQRVRVIGLALLMPLIAAGFVGGAVAAFVGDDALFAAGGIVLRGSDGVQPAARCVGVYLLAAVVRARGRRILGAVGARRDDFRRRGAVAVGGVCVSPQVRA